VEKAECEGRPSRSLFVGHWAAWAARLGISGFGDRIGKRGVEGFAKGSQLDYARTLPFAAMRLCPSFRLLG
jgi:hypothetical protein